MFGSIWQKDGFGTDHPPVGLRCAGGRVPKEPCPVQGDEAGLVGR